MNTRESLNPQSDLKTDATHSVLESVISGLIEPRQDAPEIYKPTLISNRPGDLTMHDEISDALTNSDSSTSPSPSSLLDAILSLFEDFRSHHANAPEQAAD